MADNAPSPPAPVAGFLSPLAATAYSPEDSQSSSEISSDDLILPGISLYPFIPCFVGAFTLASYLFVLLLKRCWNGRRIKPNLKETVLDKHLRDVLKGIAGDEGDERWKVDVSGEEDDTETLKEDVFQAQEFSSTLHESCRKLSSLLASERGSLSFLIPRWKWNTRKFIMSLLTEKKKYSKVADEKSALDGSLFCVPLSINYIRKKIQRSTSGSRLEGTQLLANICKDAGFEGAQLAMVCKAVHIMQENLERRWKMSLSIIRFTVANLLTIYAFWYTPTNSIKYLATYIAGELIRNAYSEPLIEWLIPKLDEETENVVLMLKLRLEDEILTGASRDDLPDDRKENLPVTDWLSSYFKKFEEVKELLEIRDRGFVRKKRNVFRRTLKSVTSTCLY